MFAAPVADPVQARMPFPTRSSLFALLRPLPFLTLAAAPLQAQLPAADGLPAHAPINPSSSRRTSLFAAPHVAPHAGWRMGLSMEYGSAIEVSPWRDSSRYLFDAEVSRVQLDIMRDIGDASFVALSVSGTGVHDGKLDAALDWFHDRVGFYMEGRETRPRNSFADSLVLADGTSIVRPKSGFQLGDTRVTVGRRHGARHQTLLTMTLPTSSGAAESGRGVPSFGVIHTLRAPLGARWLYEGSAGAGYTAAHGALAGMQRELLASASSGVRLRLGESHALYYFIFYHSPYYRGTGIPELEGSELSQDLGWIVRTRGGREWRVGITEDVVPDDQALDVVFKMSVGW